jgi:hypothetical protein
MKYAKKGLPTHCLRHLVIGFVMFLLAAIAPVVAQQESGPDH